VAQPRSEKRFFFEKRLPARGSKKLLWNWAGGGFNGAVQERNSLQQRVESPPQASQLRNRN